MAMVVKNNMAAVRTLNTLNSNSSALQKSLAKVSSGMKINSAQDDASGYAISERMRVQIRALDQANQNTQNGSSLMKTAEGAVASTIEILKTMKEKAINAATDTNTDDDRKTIQKEVDQFIDQIDDNALVTFNGKYLIEGSKAQAGDATKTAFTNQSLGAGVVGSDALTNITNRKGESLEIVSTDKVTASFVKDGTTYTTTYSVGNSTLEDIFSNLNDLRRAEITMVDSAGSETTDASAAVTFKLGSQEFNTINDSNSDAVVTVLSDAGVNVTAASTADVQTLVAGLSGDTATKVAEALAEQNIYADAQSAANAAADVFGAANLGVTTSNNAAEAATDAAEAAVANLTTTPSQAAATTDSYNWTYTTAQARVAEADNNELKAIVAAGASALTSTNTDTAELASALQYMYTHTADGADDATGGTALKADVDAATDAAVSALASAQWMATGDQSRAGTGADQCLTWTTVDGTTQSTFAVGSTNWDADTLDADNKKGGAIQLVNDIVGIIDGWADGSAALTGVTTAADAAQAVNVMTATATKGNDVVADTLAAFKDIGAGTAAVHNLADAEMIYKAAQAVSSGGSADYAAPFTGNDAKINQDTYANYFLSEDQFNAYKGTATATGLTDSNTVQLVASAFGTYTNTYNETTVTNALKAVADTLNYVLGGSGSTAPSGYDSSSMTVEDDLSNLDTVLDLASAQSAVQGALTTAGFTSSVEDSVKHMIDHFNSLKPKQEVEDAAAALDNVKDLIKAAVEDAYKGLTAVPDAPLDITISYDSDGDGTAEDYTFSADTDTDNTNIAGNTVAQDAYDEFKNKFTATATADDGLVHSGKDIGLNAAKDTVHTADDTVGLTVTAAHDSLGGQIAGLTISIANSEGQVKKTTNEFLNAFSTTIFAANESVDYSLKLHVGAQANQSISVGLQDMRAEALGLKGSDGSTLNITTQERANAAVAVLDNALAKALDQATTIGAIEARLEYTASNLTTSAENTQAAESTIRDADMAKEMTTYTKNNVLLQAAQSMLAQANQNASAVLSLLQ